MAFAGNGDHGRREAMLRFAMHGFAKRVENTVNRAMTILRGREDCTTKRNPLPLTPHNKPKPFEKRQ
jgi:hypothetical protein